MADQKSVAIHHVPFLIENLFQYYYTKQTCNCKTKGCSLSHLATSPYEHGPLALSVKVSKRF